MAESNLVYPFFTDQGNIKINADRLEWSKVAGGEIIRLIKNTKVIAVFYSHNIYGWAMSEKVEEEK